MLQSMFKTEPTPVGDAPYPESEKAPPAKLTSEPDPISSLLDAPPGSLQAAAAADRRPEAAAPEKKSLIGKIFNKGSSVDVPTVEELTSGEGADASLARTISWALRAPVDIAEAATTAVDDPEGSDATFAMEVLETLEETRNASDAALSAGELDPVRVVEAVGRALLIESVDSAVEAVGFPDRFPSEVAKLCLVTRNAGAVAAALGVDSQLGEVFYEGALPKRKVERMYVEALKLAAPEMLATMGMGGEDTPEANVAGVSLDTVTTLAPLLKIRDSKAEKLMQDAMQATVMSMMEGESGGGVGGGGGMEKQLQMLEQLIDSGAVGPGDLEELKSALSQQMGMSVEEMLDRKEELSAQLPPEGKKMFDLIERLFKPGRGGPPGGGAQGGGASKAQPPSSPEIADQIEVPGLSVAVRPGALQTSPSEAPSDGAAVKVAIRSKTDGSPVPLSEASSPVAETSSSSPNTISQPNSDVQPHASALHERLEARKKMLDS